MQLMIKNPYLLELKCIFYSIDLYLKDIHIHSGTLTHFRSVTLSVDFITIFFSWHELDIRNNVFEMLASAKHLFVQELLTNIDNDSDTTGQKVFDTSSLSEFVVYFANTYII